MSPSTTLPYSVALPYCDPALIFAVLSQHDYPLWLDSSPATADYARYSYLMANPVSKLSLCRQGVLQDGVLQQQDIFTLLNTLITRHRLPLLADLPPFQGGVAGFFSYDIAQTLEKIPSPKNQDDIFPQAMFGVYDVVIAFDHVAKSAWIITSGYPELEPAGQQERALQQCQHYLELLRELPSVLSEAPHQALGPMQACISAAEYRAAVASVKKYILEGDVFEVNISQRFSHKLPDDFAPLHLYHCLRDVARAPFGAYLDFGDYKILSASPERFAKISGSAIEVRPIKGTRPRIDDPIRDQRAAQELVDSQKDHAENVMIVDLMRNDLSRVATPESVTVTQLCGLESFATVHHLVSVITGDLAADKTFADFFAASLPGGSITGAPKIRAMEIIYEVESDKRGPYCGNLCYFGFNGQCDSSILIRSMMIHGDELYYQVGGAIVLDSDPEEEYQETLAKAATIRRALAAYGVKS